MSGPGEQITGNWIKLYRQALNNGWLQNHRLWVFWCYCLLKASHQNIEVTVGYQRVALTTGQFIFGREKAAVELAMTVKQVRTCLNALKTANNVTVKTANKFSIITVVNWHSYQDNTLHKGQEKGQEKGHKGASKGPAKGHKQECEECKEGKEIKNKTYGQFEDFWNLYPRKVNKAAALKAWQKINPDAQTVDAIHQALAWQSQQADWIKDGGKFIPHPATWLNGERWEDQKPGTPNNGMAVPHKGIIPPNPPDTDWLGGSSFDFGE